MGKKKATKSQKNKSKTIQGEKFNFISKKWKLE